MIVPRGSRNIVPYYRLGRAVLRTRHARLALGAARAARFAYTNRKAIYRIGRGIMKRRGTFRKTRARKRARILPDRSSGPSNQAWYDSVGTVNDTARQQTQSLARKQLWSAVIQLAKPPDNTEALGQAARNQIKVKGLKVCLNANNMADGDQSNYILHFALVQPKGFDTEVAPFDTDNFFSRPGGGVIGTDRTKNWVEGSVDPSIDFDINCLGINTMKWNVITHIKRQIRPKGAFYQAAGNTMRYEKYFNLKNKRVMWDAVGAEFNTRPLVALIYYERMCNNAQDTVQDIQFNFNTVTYFSNAV